MFGASYVYLSYKALVYEVNVRYYNHHRIKTRLGCSPIQYRERMIS
ncbi:TPA_asm: IS3 family transposase [Listeria monocytogenes]|nr:IS3 family transposase [Listeria monocytogenes]HAC0982458.1 IS3 family transposase [Listeria monocytogenes]